MAVYFIQDEGGEIKIGFSEGNPYRRLNTFRTGNPRELKLLVSIPGGREEEQALHERFADLRTRGEWFKPDARLLGFIEGMQYVYRDAQPEPVGDADTICGLSVAQLQACAGYTMAYEAMSLACAYSSLRDEDRDDLAQIRRYLASRLKYIRQLSDGEHAMGASMRSILAEIPRSPSDLIDALIGESSPDKAKVH